MPQINSFQMYRYRPFLIVFGCNHCQDSLLLAHGQWFSPGTPASSNTKTGRHDIADILLKVALKHQKSNQKSY
jgi:hypothetical protein